MRKDKEEEKKWKRMDRYGEKGFIMIDIENEKEWMRKDKEEEKVWIKIN